MADLEPRNIIEVAYLRSIASHTIAALRWRGIKMALLRGNSVDAPMEPVDQERMSKGWVIERQAEALLRTWVGECNPSGVIDKARLHLELEPRRLAYVDQLWEAFERERKPAHDPISAPVKPAALPPKSHDQPSPYLKYGAQIEFANRQIHRAEPMRDPARRDLEEYRAGDRPRAGSPTDIIDAEFTEVKDDLRAQARRQSPKRPKEHGPANADRTSQSQSERPHARAQRRRAP